MKVLRFSSTIGRLTLCAYMLGLKHHSSLALMPQKQVSTQSTAASSITTYTMVEQRILFIRGQKVMLDRDLAELYGVATRVLNQAVKRNLERFPKDFMFQLTKEETQFLRSQFVISNQSRGGRRYLPYAFTEHGAVMLASVLNSETAINASIQVVRAFVRLRSLLAAHKELAKKLESFEKKTDTKFKVVFDLIAKYLKPEQNNSKKRIGFETK